MAIPGWDERDYELWSKIRQLPSYGLIAENADNPAISRREVIKLLENAARERRAYRQKEENHED